MRYRGEEEQARRQAALYALGILNQHESEIFETRLREGCTTCRHALEEFRSAVRELHRSAPKTVPPAYLKDLVLARVAREPMSPTTAIPQATAAETRTSPRPPSKQKGPVLAWVLAVAALVAAGYLLYIWQETERSLQTETFKTAVLESEARELQGELTEAALRLETLEEMRRILGLPNSRMIRLEGSDASPAGEVYWSPQDNLLIVSARLEQPPPGRQYLIWYLSGPQTPHAAGTLDVQAPGEVLQKLELSSDLPPLTAVGVTLEEVADPEDPTTPFLLRGVPN